MPIQSNITGGAITQETDPTVPSHVKAISTGDISGWNNTKRSYQLSTPFNVDYATLYREITVSGGKVTAINYWDNSGKANKLFTKTITYTGDLPTTITMLDEKNSKTLTKTITYSGTIPTTVTEVIT